MFKKYKDFIISLFLFLLAFMTRFFLISKGPFHMDTLELAINAQKTLDTLNLHYQHWLGFPLTVIVSSIFIFLLRLIGVYDPVFSVNFMSVVFGSLAVGIFYLFSRRILDLAGALSASLIFAFLPLNVSVSTFGMTHPVSIFFNLMGVYFLFLYFQQYKLNKLIWSAVFFGFGAAARLTDGLIVIVAIFLYLAWSFKNSDISKKRILRRFMLFLASYSIIILLFYLPMFLKTGLSQFKDAVSAYYNYYSLSDIYVSSKWLVDILSLSGVLMTIAGLGYFFLEKNRILFYFLIVWFISLFTYYGSYSCTDHRYLLLSIIPILILQGHFISKIFKRIPFLSSIVIFIFIITNFLEAYPSIQFRHKYNLQRDFAEFVQRDTEPSSYIIAIDEGPFMEYYGNRKILYRTIGLNKKDYEEFFKKIDILLGSGVSIYIISSCMNGYDPNGYFKKMLVNNYHLKYIGSHLYEDWNRTTIKQHLFIQKLYRIEKKS